ncbi:hypothetical protein Tco_1347197 [Tanacetum coccineum]
MAPGGETAVLTSLGNDGGGRSFQLLCRRGGGQRWMVVVAIVDLRFTMSVPDDGLCGGDVGGRGILS